MSFTGELRVIAEDGAPAMVTIPQHAGIDTAVGWLTDQRSALFDLLRVHGALLLRGLPVVDIASFAAVRDVLIGVGTPYREKATPRSELGKDVLSSTELAASLPIRMHNENSYTLTFPGTLLFGCLVAPESGGATPIADVRRVLEHVPRDTRERMRSVGWILERSYSEHISLSWQTAFSANTREEVQQYCDEQLISTEWQPDGGLRTSQRRPGIIRHPHTGEEVWFNHMAFWNGWSLDQDVRETLVSEFGWRGLPFQTRLGDGTDLTEQDVAQLHEAYDAATLRRPWRVGDLLLIDNILAAHGRDPYVGPRQIVVAMGDPIDIDACGATVVASK